MPADITSLSNARAALDAAQGTLVQSLIAERRAAAALAAARKRGVSAAEIERLARAAARAQETVATERGGRASANAALAAIEAELLTLGLTPELQMASQTRSVPVALLPVRIETRYVGNDLLIRIYPDQIHLHLHVSDVSHAEIASTKAYWTALFAGEPADAAWTALAAGTGPERARYLIHRLRPANADAQGSGAAPAFPDVEGVETLPQARPEARMLPTRWCATLTDPAGNRIARKWSGGIRQPLMMSPAGDVLDALADAGDGPLKIDPAARWLVDFGEAEAAGMAIRITPAEIAAGTSIDHIARLVVVGTDWTRAPGEAATALSDHLEAHSWSDGFGLVPPGTPTNNNASGSSGLDMPARARLATMAPGGTTSPDTRSDLALLGRALGLDTLIARLDGCAGTTRAYDYSVAAVHDALWGASFGFFLGHALDPWFPREKMGDVRAHLAEHVRPDGPLPTVRIGRQPYGVLPVLATPVKMDRDADLQRMGDFVGPLAAMIGRIRFSVENTGADGGVHDVLGDIPTIFDGEGDSAERLAKILKHGPISRRGSVRPTINRAVSDHSEASYERAAERHADIVTQALANLRSLDLVSIARAMTYPLIYQLISPARPRYRLDPIPWVAADLDDATALTTAVAAMQARIAAATANSKGVPGLLAIHANQATTLFEGLLFLSGAFDYWEAARRLVEDFAVLPEGAGFAVSARQAVSDVATAGLIGIEDVVAPAQHVAIETPRQLLQVNYADIGAVHVAGHIAELLERPEPPLPVRDAKRFNSALEVLKGRPPREIDRALRGLLDVGSHRLDAWVTSIATRRLAEQRGDGDGDRAEGIHIGAYGIVHDVRRGSGGESEGFLHLPSLDHAVTASILRAGHAANRDDDPEAFAVRLTSPRVREAMLLTEGMAAGQRLDALIGYRFERKLIEGRTLAKYIMPFRLALPLSGVADVPDAGATAIGARDVVDGLKLAERSAEPVDRAALLDEVAAKASFAMTGADRTALDGELDAVAALFDAFLDLWTVEATHQLVRGSAERSAAAAAVIDRQERPQEPRAMKTPRGSRDFVQRVAWLMPADAKATGWPSDTASAAEPVANAMAAQLMGDPGRFEIVGRVVGADGQPLAGEADRVIDIGDLGLSPLGIVRACGIESSEGVNRLQEWAAARIAAAAALPEGAGVELVAEASDVDKLGFGKLEALAATIRAALFGRAAFEARHFVAPAGVVPSTAAADVIADRASSVREAVVDARGGIASLVADGASPTAAAVRKAVTAASEFVGVPVWLMAAREAAFDDAARAQIMQIDASLRILIEKFDALSPAPLRSNAVDSDRDDEKADTDTDRIRAVLGPDFPVLPPVQPPGASRAEWTAALDDQAALLAPLGPRAIGRWQRQHGLVRPQVHAANAAMDAASWTGTGIPSVGVIQSPHQPGARWAALPLADPPADDADAPEDVRMSTLFWGDVSADRLAGFLIDEWVDSIPDRSATTSVAFHYDAPAARPPQTLLIAVDAGIDQGGWTADSLVATVNEAFDLARLRMIRPDQIRGHGAVLPTTFLPRNLSEEVPSLDLFGMVGELATHVAASPALGKVAK